MSKFAAIVVTVGRAIVDEEEEGISPGLSFVAFVDVNEVEQHEVEGTLQEMVLHAYKTMLEHEDEQAKELGLQ